MAWVLTGHVRRVAFGAVVAVGAAAWTIHGFAAGEAPPPAATEDSKPAAPVASDFKFEISVPSVEVVDSSIDGDTIKAIIEGKASERAADLATLNAKSIRIPEFKLTFAMTVDGKPAHSVTTYRDWVFQNINNGVAESLSVAGATVTGDDGSADIGAGSAKNIDVGALLALYGLAPPRASTEMKTVFADLVFEGGKMTFAEGNCTIGRMTMAELKARPLKTSYAEMFALLGGMSDSGRKPAPEEIQKLIAFYGDLLMSFESSPFAFGGFDCSGTGDNGKPFSLGVGPVTIGAFQPGSYPAIEASDVGFAADGGTFSLADVAFKGFDYTVLLQTLESAEGKFDEAWAAANARKLIPDFRGFRVGNLKMDLPEPDGAGRIRASIGGFDLSLGAYVNGIPTDVAAAATHIAFALPEDIADENAERLKALGYDDVDFSYDIALKWDPETETIKVDKLSVAGVDMGSFALSGLVGQAVKELFSEDTDLALGASVALALKQLNLSVEDDGLGRRLLQLGAAEKGMDPATYVNSIAGAAQGTILTVLGGSPQVQALAQAIGAFVSGAADSLEVAITTKDEAGLGLVDMDRIQQNPAALSEIVDIEAAANKRQ